MATPTYDRFIEPVLRYLAKHPEGALARDAHEAAADALGLGEEDRAEMIPSGNQPVYKNRAGWAHDRLKRAGLSSSARRGFWQLTEEGVAFAARTPPPLPEAMIERFALADRGQRLKPIIEAGGDRAPDLTASPEERLDAALAEIRQAVAAEILESLSQVSPQHFERIVLDLLHQMGYGARREDIQQVGGAGDAGIDGVISLDRLGLEKVYVQAKRWANNVGRPEVQAFYGALAGQRAKKGVFLTTSSFSPQALDFARSVEGVVLVDGARLAALMMDHEVGVSSRTLKIPRLDSDYFEP
jgi:restriction system protein